MVDVLLADTQPLTAAGIVHFLQDRPDLKLVASVTTRDELSALLDKHAPQVLIADYNIPGFITIDDLRKIGKASPATNILIISSDNNKSSIKEVLQAGVKGYLTKDCSKEEVMLAIQSTAKGEKFFCHKILDIILEKHFAPAPRGLDPTVLTIRETEILKLLAAGYSTQKIADQLHVSPHTIHTHRKSIIRKLNIKSPTEFVIYAMDFGLINPSIKE
jgi:two-component system invasion response regulator UvrY